MSRERDFLEDDYAAADFALVHVVVGFVDLVEGVVADHQLVEVQLAGVV